MNCKNTEKMVPSSRPIKHIITMKRGSEEPADHRKKYEISDKVMYTALELIFNERDGGEIAKKLHEIATSVGSDPGKIVDKGGRETVKGGQNV